MKIEDYDKPKSHGRARRGIGILLVVLMLWETSLVFIQHPHPLLERASVALAFKSLYNWQDLALNDGVPIVATLSDTNWLVGQLDTPKNFLPQYNMDRLEFNPQRRIANTSLASLLNQSGTLVGDMEPSPDRQWVIGTLLTDPYPRSPALRVASAIDGSHVARWSTSLPEYESDPSLRSVNGSYIAWMPDSRNVAEIVASQAPSGTFRLLGTLHNVYSGGTSTLQFSAPGLPERGAQLAIRPDVLLFSSISNLDQAWTSPVRRLLKSDMGRETVKPTTVDLYSWPLRQSGAAAQISHLKTPLGTWLVGLAFSPDGKRIAWEVVREIPPSPLEYLRCHLWSQPVPAPSEQIEVWTSGLKGSVMEMIGYLPRKEYWNEGNIGMSLHLSWLPGGKGLRFVFEDTIYTVKAD